MPSRSFHKAAVTTTNPLTVWKTLSHREPRDEVRFLAAAQRPTPKGTPYPGAYISLTTLLNGCSQPIIFNNIRIYNAYLATENGRTKTLEYATSRLEQTLRQDSLRPSLQSAAAIRRLLSLNTLKAWGPDIVYKAFADLSTLLFGEMMKDRVQLRWQTAAQMAESPSCNLHNDPNEGCTCFATTWFEMIGIHLPEVLAETEAKVEAAKAAGEEPPQYPVLLPAPVPYRKIMIDLNATRLFLCPPTHRDRWDEMFGSLIHEMVHAYVMVAVDHKFRDFMWSDHDREHGEHFLRCLVAVNARLESAGLWLGGICEGGCWGEGCGCKGHPCESEDEHEHEEEEEGGWWSEVGDTKLDLKCHGFGESSTLEP